MANYRPPIVVVAYNRPKSLERILTSLSLANYPEFDISLIISIDKKEDNEDVLEIAKSYSWDHGPKEIRYQETNLGLKAHILKCGDISLDYNSVIVLEDDLYVSPNFYYFAVASLEYTKNDHRVGGISLYNHQLNVHTRDHFSALEDGYDNWYFQFASSWGQVWSSDQWKEFREWYSGNMKIEQPINVPKYVLSWSDSSWLKYYISYLVDKDRFFLYPKISLSTNFSDAGTHIRSDSTIYQVPLLYTEKKTFLFSNLGKSNSVYDAFYESLCLSDKIGVTGTDCCIDLHGYKVNEEKRFWLTCKVLDYKIIRSYGRSLKPIEANILQDIEGTDLFLYDTNYIVSNPNKYDGIRRLLYSIKQISLSQVILIGRKLTLQKIRNLKTRLFRR